MNKFQRDIKKMIESENLTLVKIEVESGVSYKATVKSPGGQQKLFTIRSSGDPRAIKNTRAELRRWVRELNEAPPTPIRDPKRMPARTSLWDNFNLDDHLNVIRQNLVVLEQYKNLRNPTEVKVVKTLLSTLYDINALIIQGQDPDEEETRAILHVALKEYRDAYNLLLAQQEAKKEEQRQERRQAALKAQEERRKKTEETRRQLEEGRKRREQELADEAAKKAAQEQEEEMAIKRDVREYEKMVSDEGLTIVGRSTGGSGHLLYDLQDKHGNRKTFTISKSSSDFRAPHRRRSDLRKWMREMDEVASNAGGTQPRDNQFIVENTMGVQQLEAAQLHKKPTVGVISPPMASVPSIALVPETSFKPVVHLKTAQPKPEPIVLAPPPPPPPVKVAPGTYPGNSKEYHDAYMMLKDDVGAAGKPFLGTTSDWIKVRNWIVDHPEVLNESVVKIGIKAMLELHFPIAYPRLRKLVAGLNDEKKKGPLKHAEDYTASAQGQLPDMETPSSTLPGHSAIQEGAALGKIEETASGVSDIQSTVHDEQPAARTPAPVKDQSADDVTTAILKPEAMPDRDVRIEQLENTVRLLTKTVRSLCLMQGVDVPKDLRDLLRDL